MGLSLQGCGTGGFGKFGGDLLGRFGKSGEEAIQPEPPEQQPESVQEKSPPPHVLRGAPSLGNSRYAIHVVKPKETAEALGAAYLGSTRNAWIIRRYNNVEKLSPGMEVLIPRGIVDMGQITENGFQVVTSLCYHRFEQGTKKNKMVISPEEFSRQMQYLRDEGYTALTARQMVDYLAGRSMVPQKSVYITIDDGFRSAYTVAYPILKKMGFVATFFIYPAVISQAPVAMTWEQLREIVKDGFDVGSHTMTHDEMLRLPDDTEESYQARLRTEVFESKRLLEKKIGRKVTVFAYSFGRYDETSMKAVFDAGYEAAFTVVRGANPSFQWPYAVKRTQVYPGLSDERFAKMVDTFFRFSVPWKDYVRR